MNVIYTISLNREKLHSSNFFVLSRINKGYFRIICHFFSLSHIRQFSQWEYKFNNKCSFNIASICMSLKSMLKFCLMKENYTDIQN